MQKKVVVALKMAGIAGQDKLAGIFRYLSETYGDDAPWDIQLVRTRAELTPALVRDAIAAHTDGFILSIPETEEAARPLAAVKIPTIAMDISTAALAARSERLAFIRNSGEEIGREAALYFMRQGAARSYGFLHPDAEQDWSRARFAAFRDTLRENGLWCEELHAPADAARLKRPAAVLAANDDRAFELIRALRARRLKSPQDVAVMGVDNDTLICENSRPRISSVQPDFEQEGYLAAMTLDAMMRGEESGATARTLFAGVKAVVRRESTAEPSHAGRLVQKAVAYIDRHALEGIGVEDVVAHLKCSRRLADLRFRQLQGRTMLEAITERRLDEVRRLLRSTREPIERIAEACGYSNGNYLKNLFKRRFAMTMSEFRAQSSLVAGE